MKKIEQPNELKVHFSVSLVIPVFNNGKTASKQLQKCLEIMDRCCEKYEIVISDDKSTDGTIHELAKFKDNRNIHIILQKENLGIAKNIRYLYEQARYSYVLLFSIDGDWDTNDIERLIVHASRTKSDIVIGKRDRQNDAFFRRSVSFFYNMLPFIFFGVHTYDAGSIKIFKKSLFNRIALTLQSVSFESEFLIKAVKGGAKVSTIPITYIRNKDSHKSSVKWKLIAASLADLIKLRFERI